MIFFIIAIAIFVLDFFIKQYIEKNKTLGKSEKIFKDRIIVTKYHNQGAFLNFMEKKREILLLLSGIMIGGITILMAIIFPQKGKRILKTGIAFLAGGAASNVYDRLKRGYVVDYFSFSFYQKVIFNISDFFIFLGSIVLAVRIIFKGLE
ncbi:signal peptidase II [Lachnoclostridium phytofermentans]|uniref:Lipoprotein signal peptidase n=1 Tax=Lachnoclostridium phytofermentans (strain ATCC 700394 / DSM 18823 / ISDg) TaxID=357809 RepID=A9KSR7_LACP7|nr:signal peptidase II [Lachnoclostridium phytofermentans]ABX40711.1 peptidase A8 signal peptidase II [Lachnoclostridium phytofermentans ISDg]